MKPPIRYTNGNGHDWNPEHGPEPWDPTYLDDMYIAVLAALLSRVDVKVNAKCLAKAARRIVAVAACAPIPEDEPEPGWAKRKQLGASARGPVPEDDDGD